MAMHNAFSINAQRMEAAVPPKEARSTRTGEAGRATPGLCYFTGEALRAALPSFM
jgi:hypothetical protein